MKVDRKLIGACIKGDRRAQRELYGLCLDQLLGVCFRFANNEDDASILLNEAFFKILENLENQNKEVPFMAWATRITVNHCISEYRKDRTRKRVITAMEPEDLDQSSQLRILDDEKFEYDPRLLKKVRKEILNLPPMTQEVFQLYVFQNCSHYEVAELLGIKEGTSKWHLFNARSILREALIDDMKEVTSIAL
ncbi:MAG: hypothetical protein CL840_06885 [Crocinitomicaceae bacterium]|nr:hypothetical protein [Crocinitomicaceae bacterium]|tara:strand:+ start:1410 stop:1988 length:579 start_codon:yes stop_codon:yes gene_type:complete